MRCSEARQKLIKLADSSVAGEEKEALREHLNRCPRCARLALAERLLTGDIEQLRHVRLPHPMTVEQVREGIAIREESERKANLGVRIMRLVRETVYRRPRLSIVSAAVIAVLLASVLVPVRTEHPIGYEVTFAAPITGLVLNEENTERMLAALDLNDASLRVHESDSGVEYTIAPLQDSAQVRRLITALNSLGGRRVWNVKAASKSKERTIWQLLVEDNQSRTENATVDINLNEIFQDDFTLWMPVGDQLGDSLHGLLLDRRGDRTNIRLMGLATDIAPNDCGWNSLLNGKTILNTPLPDGELASFDLADIEDVRELERAGYNFWLMEFDTPGQIPVPGMGPKLNEIEPNPFADETVIEYMVPRAHEVQVQILDKPGREIRILLDCIALAGIYHVIWDGLDANGDQVEPGTYLCRFIAGDYVETQEIVLER